MEEKINNQKIVSYIPSLIARLILNSSLQDKDIFADNLNQNQQQTSNAVRGKNAKGKSQHVRLSQDWIHREQAIIRESAMQKSRLPLIPF